MIAMARSSSFVRRLVLGLAALLCLAVTLPARAALTIDVVGAGANQISIAIVPFRAEEGLKQGITPVIAADLARSCCSARTRAPPPLAPTRGLQLCVRGDGGGGASWRARAAAGFRWPPIRAENRDAPACCAASAKR